MQRRVGPVYMHDIYAQYTCTVRTVDFGWNWIARDGEREREIRRRRFVMTKVQTKSLIHHTQHPKQNGPNADDLDNPSKESWKPDAVLRSPQPPPPPPPSIVEKMGNPLEMCLPVMWCASSFVLTCYSPYPHHSPPMVLCCLVHFMHRLSPKQRLTYLGANHRVIILRQTEGANVPSHETNFAFAIWRDVPLKQGTLHNNNNKHYRFVILYIYWLYNRAISLCI